jgi:hypothetical protein
MADRDVKLMFIQETLISNQYEGLLTFLELSKENQIALFDQWKATKVSNLTTTLNGLEASKQATEARIATEIQDVQQSTLL